MICRFYAPLCYRHACHDVDFVAMPLLTFQMPDAPACEARERRAARNICCPAPPATIRDFSGVAMPLFI